MKEENIKRYKEEQIIFEFPYNTKNVRIKDDTKIVYVKAFDIDILKINKETGYIYFNNKKNTKTFTKYQNYIKTWLGINELQITDYEEPIVEEIDISIYF